MTNASQTSLVFNGQDEASILKQKKLDKQKEFRKALEQQIIEKREIKEQEKKRQIEHDLREEERIKNDLNINQAKIDCKIKEKYKNRRPKELDKIYIQTQFNEEENDNQMIEPPIEKLCEDLKQVDYLIGAPLIDNCQNIEINRKLKQVNQNFTCIQSPQKQTVSLESRKYKHRTSSVIECEGKDSILTPNLACNIENDIQHNNCRDSYLEKYQDSNNNAMSNHLYKYTNKIFKRNEFNDCIKNIMNLSTLGSGAVYEQKETNKANLSIKRVLQRTPISSNAINHINKFNLESPSIQGKHHKQNTHTSGGESLTTATSKRKLSSKIKISYGVPSKTESCSESISTEIDSKIRRSSIPNDDRLIKRSLERIDNAIKRNCRVMYSNESMPFDVLKETDYRNKKNSIKCKDESYQESIQMHNVPFSGINMYIQNIAKSEKHSNSVAYESDCQDIENFTLGPNQFSRLVSESK